MRPFFILFLDLSYVLWGDYLKTKRVQGITAVFLICIAFSMVAGSLFSHEVVRGVGTKNTRYILDPGHGDPDGGAVGLDGTTEQQLNLDIALLIAERLNAESIPFVLTRNNSSSIYSEGKSIHQKKVSDIRNRIQIANQNKDSIMVSIHMNSFPNHDIRGIQVFYSDRNTVAYDIAEKIQSAVNRDLQPQNPKKTKEISSNIYLFSHIDNPSVLVECGFISNECDLTNLKKKEYQEMLANTISEVLAAYG